MGYNTNNFSGLGLSVGHSLLGGDWSTEQGYRAYGPGACWARRVGSLATDHRFTGQFLAGAGLMYYNARYYDPELGQFISPDTLVPDATNLFDYNRYLYTRGNPMNRIDPTGHETDKPEWWPDWLPYTFDLPDDMTIAEFQQWVRENNIPTTIGTQGGVDITGKYFVGATSSAEFGWMFNWWSGELAYQITIGGGFVAGLSPDVNPSAHFGITWVAGAETIRGSVQGTSVYQTGSLQAEALATAGVSFTAAEAIDSGGQLEVITLAEMADSFIDPNFDRTVNSGSINVSLGVDPASTLVDPSYGAGLSTTKVVGSVDVYAPFVNLYQWFAGGR